MATPDDSPSHFAEQSWSEWAKIVPSPPYCDSGGDSSESKISDDSDSMKLKLEDSALFGICPSQDEFYLIECEKCKQVIKPQAFKKHLLTRHGSTNRSVKSIEDGKMISTTSRSSKTSPSPSKARSMGLSVPTKASMKEIPPSISSARKMGGELHARLKASDKPKRNHTMPVVKVERMDVKKMSRGSSNVQEDTSQMVINGESHGHFRKTPTPISEVLSAEKLLSQSQSSIVSSKKLITTTTSITLPPNFKSTFTSRPLSPPKSVTHVLLKTNTTPSVSMATPTLTTATTTCMTTTMTTSHTSPQVSATVALNSMSFSNNFKPFKNDIDITNLQNLEVDDEIHEIENSLTEDLNLNKIKIEHQTPDEGYSSSVQSVSDNCLNLKPEPKNEFISHKLSSLSDTKLSIHTPCEPKLNLYGNRTFNSLDNSSSLKQHLLSGRKNIKSDATLNITSSPSLNSISNSSLSSLSSTSLNNGTDSDKKKYPRLLFGKADKIIPCKDREYDPDKHCGVVGDDEKPCTRSLTCKTHAISRRRKVAGRRKPFDDLLKEHRAAKEILLKQKAEMKQAAAMGLTSPSALQTGTPTIQDFPIRPGQTKPEKENNSLLSSHSDSHLAIFKPVKPNSLQSHRSSISSLHSFSTPSPKDDLKPPDFPERADDDEDNNYIPYHPRPAAMCTFGARYHSNNAGKRCYTFTRRSDMFRAAFLSALEKHLTPPPAKKRCVESNLPKDNQTGISGRDPYEFQSLEMGGIPQVQHFNPVLNQVETSTTKSKSRSSGGGKHKKQDNSGSKSPSNATSNAIINAIGNSAKRKRSTSGVPVTNVTLATNLRTVSSNSTIQTVGAPTVMGNITINSQGTTPLIAIPNVNLSSSTLSHLSANLNNSKQPKNSAILKDIKDIGLVLTNLDGSIVNGQYLNLTAAPQPLDDKVLQQHILGKNNKVVNLDQLKSLPKSNLIPVNHLLIEGQPGATVLAPVSLAPISNSSNIVSITSNVSQAHTTPLLVSQNLKPGSVSSHVTLTSIPNGVITSDKSNPRPQGVVHHKPKSIHPQQGILTSNSQQVCGGQIFTTQLAQLQVKPMNIAKSGSTGELSMQPVSLTFPLANLRVPGQQHQMQTFYITSTNDTQQHDSIQQQQTQQMSNSPSVS